MIHNPIRHRKRSPRTASEPAHRLIRDAVEAEEIAVDWLRSRGFSDVSRTVTDRALGIRGAGVVAHVTFDPLPMERDVLEALALAAAASDIVVSFTLAGWTPESFAWADRHGVPLVRFTFAGHLDPSNEPARVLRTA